jgi:hypothetical protein
MLCLICVLQRERPNAARILDLNGSVMFETGYSGPPIEGDPRPADHPEVSEPYIAYSPNATVEVSCVLSAAADLQLNRRASLIMLGARDV